MNEQVKLSTAMRKGAKLRPQEFSGSYYRRYEGQFCSCAMGAALEAVRPEVHKSLVNGTYTESGILAMTLEQVFPALAGWDRPLDDTSQVFKCPKPEANIGCLNNYVSLPNLIAHLNDDHRWTREQIADWLEGQGL